LLFEAQYLSNIGDSNHVFICFRFDIKALSAEGPEDEGGIKAAAEMCT